MRGFAPTLHCPRCHAPVPTGAGTLRLVTCSRCGLGFDIEAGMRAPPEAARRRRGEGRDFAPVHFPHRRDGDRLTLLVDRPLHAPRVLGHVGVAGAVVGGFVALVGPVALVQVGIVVAAVSARAVTSAQRVVVERDRVRGRAGAIRGELIAVSTARRSGRYVVEAVASDGDLHELCETTTEHIARVVAEIVIEHRAALGAPVRGA